MMSTPDYYKPYFLDTHSKFKNIFYDTDFSEIRKHINAISALLKTMDLRQTRSKTLQIAKSVFDYESQQDFYQQYPHLYYDFRFGDVRICIGCRKYKRDLEYFVNCCGWNPPEQFSPYVGHFGYGSGKTAEDVFPLFSDIVGDFISTRKSALF